MRFELQTVGDKQAARKLASLGDGLDGRPLLEGIADILIDAEQRHWRNGTGWRGKPLAASTRERKRRQHLPARAMTALGNLERALTRRGAPGQLLEFNRHEVRFGIKGGRSPVYYGRFHQRGRGVPKRVIVPEPTAQTRRALAGLVRDTLNP